MKNLGKMTFYVVILTLCIMTTIYLTLAWFTSNKTTDHNPVSINTDTRDCDAVLYVYNNGEYVEVTDINKSFTNFMPGNVLYFKLSIMSKSNNLNYKIMYGDFESKISPNLVYTDNSITTEVTDSNNQSHTICLYETIDNKVTITEQNEDKILYEIKDGTLSLKDYKLENTIKSYTIGLDSDIEPSIENLSGTFIKENKLIYKSINPLEKNAHADIIFALEFNEQATLVNGNSNCYSFQDFLLDGIVIDIGD